ncbi:hypothetical protein LCGC14_2561350, partial [marine sediment metagenome]
GFYRLTLTPADLNLAGVVGWFIERNGGSAFDDPVLIGGFVNLRSGGV